MKRLTDAMIAKRRDRAKGFVELAAGEKPEFILTLDEAMLPLNFKNSNTSHSYELQPPLRSFLNRSCSQLAFLGEVKLASMQFQKTRK